MQRDVSRANIVTAARAWIGTPYHHQAALKGVGCDCLGLVRGVYREVLGDADGNEIHVPVNYSRDWAEASGIEAMLDGARRVLTETETAALAPGDVVIFRLRPGCVAKHAGIVATPATFVHAMEGGPVSEVALSAWWRRRVAGVFQFPNLASGPNTTTGE